MLGTRAIWHKGWKAATAVPAAPESWGDFHQQRWELFDTEADPSECNDLAQKHPEKLQELIALWWAEAGKYGALPLESRSAIEILGAERPQLSEPRPVRLLPRRRRSARVRRPEHPQPLLHDRRRDSRSRRPKPAVCIFSQGSRFGGHALYLRGGKLKYVYNWLGIHVQTVEADAPIPTGHVYLSASFERENTNCRPRAHSACTSVTRRSANRRSSPSRASSGSAAAAS